MVRRSRKNKFKPVVVLFVLILFITACSKSTDIKNETSEPITFTFYNCDGSEDPWSDPVALEITKATGVSLETLYPSNENDTDIMLMIATGELPDLVFAKGDSYLLIENNDLIDMSDLIDEYGPHIKELYGDDYDLLRYSNEDPSIYLLCSDQVEDEILDTSGTCQLQWAVLAENNYEIPTTLEDYSNMIRIYMKKHPTINNEDTIGISISVSDWHWYTTLSNPAGFIANGSVDNGQWIVENNGEVLYKHTAENQKEYFMWLNEMYHEGILDPDFATQTHEDYISKIASGRVLGLLDANWDYQSAESSLMAEGLGKRTYAGLPVTLDENIVCASLEQQNLSVGWGIGITKSCKDPVRAIKFLDWLCTKEAQVLLNWGIEGVNYYYDESGARYRTQGEILRSQMDTNYISDTGVGAHSYPFPSYGNMAKDDTGNYINVTSKNDIIASYNDEEKKALEAWDKEMLIDIFPSKDEFSEVYYTPLWSKLLDPEINEKLASLDAISWKCLIDAIVCPTEQFDMVWDAYQQKLIDAGVEELEEQMTKLVQSEIKFHTSSN